MVPYGNQGCPRWSRRDPRSTSLRAGSPLRGQCPLSRAGERTGRSGREDRLSGSTSSVVLHARKPCLLVLTLGGHCSQCRKVPEVSRRPETSPQVPVSKEG